jgi:hypothetical protein
MLRNFVRLRTTLAACLFALLLGCIVNADGDDKKDKETKEPTTAQMKIAQAIAGGHSYEKHVVDEKQFPEVKNEKEFKELIGKILANPTHHRDLENDREAYYDKPSNTIVIYNPHAKDKGTCFRPSAGLRYFENLK